MNLPPDPLSPAPAGPESERELFRRGNALFWLWEEADRRVPYRWLYAAEALPRPGTTARDLDDLVLFEFVYRIAEGFVARLAGERGSLSLPVLLREDYQYRLMPIRERAELMPPSQALAVLVQDLERRERDFWERILLPPEAAQAAAAASFGHFSAHGWESLRLQQPFAAGIREPFYQFRKPCAAVEFWVGAQTGTVSVRPSHRHGHDHGHRHHHHGPAGAGPLP
ncbi:MAG: hypothetical protein JSR82_22980 [Verrucomicrobia bacterium]|nr:hypothetical protein [Verrucomicrobiota bacterium]